MSLFKKQQSLNLQMILSFTLLGILVGYFSILTTVVISTRSFVQFTGALILNHIKAYEDAPQHDFLLSYLNRNHAEIHKIKKIIADMGSDFSAIAGIAFYYKSAQTGEWKKIDWDDHDMPNESPVDQYVTPILKKAMMFKFIHSGHLFWGGRDRISYFINITLPDDTHTYILNLDVYRLGLFSLLKKHMSRFCMLGIMLLCGSAGLGILFSRRLIAPIKKLSKDAEILSSGNYSQRFNLKRNDELGILSSALDRMAERIETHIREIEQRVKTMETMNQIDKAVLSSISRNDLMDRVVGIVSSLFNHSTVAMVLYNEKKKRFELLSYYQSALKGMVTGPQIVDDTTIPTELMKKAETYFQLIVDGTQKVMPSFFINLFGRDVMSITNTPIFLSEAYLGSLIIAKTDPQLYSATDQESIRMLADQVGVAMGSVFTYEEKERLFLGILLSLTKAIDAKSKWTAGHSERVTRYAELIGEKLRMDQKTLNELSISAILHDIGKIAVPETILDKPGRLTEDEFIVIKSHPGKGADIISDIPSYDRILPGILYHHEKWNGTGYPKELKQDEIPLNARIICLADVWDAIISDRPYRPGMKKEDALRFMMEQKGEMFDPDLTEVFINLVKDTSIKPG